MNTFLFIQQNPEPTATEVEIDYFSTGGQADTLTYQCQCQICHVFLVENENIKNLVK